MAIRICDWKHGKKWVYSITYDEALIELHERAVPIHDAFWNTGTHGGGRGPHWRNPATRRFKLQRFSGI